MTRLEHHDQLLAIFCAMVAGFVDAVGFLASGGFFLSFMSGNSTRLAVGLSEAATFTTLAALLLGSFVGGVVVASYFGRKLSGSHRQRQGTILGAIALILFLSPVLAPQTYFFTALALTAAAMGAVNVLYERDGAVSFGLTYMTGALVKIGQGIATALDGGDRFGWVSYLLLWLGLLGGAIGGAAMFSRLDFASLWFAAVVTTILSTSLLVSKRSMEGG
jgi:uncharacterized membrane protein YoaK (UPF0700 family)